MRNSVTLITRPPPSGVLLFLFEYWTFGFASVKVWPWLWNARVVAYAVCALPGFFTFFGQGLMPVFLPALYCTITCAVNIGATRAQLPTQKEWAWPWFGSKEQKKKAEEAGGTYKSLGGALADIPKTVVRSFEQGTLPRVVFLTWYSLLNIVVGFEAYFRHGNSDKGRALRGESFRGCRFEREILGYDGVLEGIAPVPPDWSPFGGRLGDESGTDFLCRDGSTPLEIPAFPKLQEYWVGFGWLGYPGAKACGQLLNLNCAVLLVPVLRSLVRRLQDLTSIKGPPALRFLAKVFIPDKNIVFHKAVAKVRATHHASQNPSRPAPAHHHHLLSHAADPADPAFSRPQYFIFVLAVVHGLLHYFNYSRAPYYNAQFGPGGYSNSAVEMAWFPTYGGFGLTGELIVLAMFTIYSGANDKVKRSRDTNLRDAPLSLTPPQRRSRIPLCTRTGEALALRDVLEHAPLLRVVLHRAALPRLGVVDVGGAPPRPVRLRPRRRPHPAPRAHADRVGARLLLGRAEEGRQGEDA